MDRATRFIANRKQDKIRVVREQPSIQSMREGEEVLYFRNSGTLTRYRKERGKLWTSDMHGSQNKHEKGKLTVDNLQVNSRLEYTTSFVDYRMFSHNFTDDLPGTKIYIPWQGTGEQTSFPEARSSFLAPFDMTCHKIMIRLPEMDNSATDIVFTIERIKNQETADDEATVCTYDATDSWNDDNNFTISQNEWNANPKISAGEMVQIGLNADNTNIITSEKHFIITSVWKVVVII
tara:strand:- start:55 stop:759 length:705 start_codon:yes stop_codon:yes gene_type:complete